MARPHRALTAATSASTAVNALIAASRELETLYFALCFVFCVHTKSVHALKRSQSQNDYDFESVRTRLTRSLSRRARRWTT